MQSKIYFTTLVKVRHRLRCLRQRLKHALKKLILIDEAKITKTLRGFGEFKSQYLIVHSSLSQCGYISGGPQTIIKAIRNWIGAATLVMPTHTYCYPDLLGSCPVFDAELTPSQVGTITEHFRRVPGVVRSVHPTHSICAQGPQSEAVCRGHEFCDTPCGKGTPYEHLIQNDAAVLMFGVSLNAYTLFHTAEDAAQAPYLYEAFAYILRYLQKNTEKVIEMQMRRQNNSVLRCFSSMDEWLKERGLLYKRKLGNGTLLFIPHAKLVHEALLFAMREDPFLLVASTAKQDYIVKRNA